MHHKNKRGVTGLQLVMGSLLYFMGIFILFSFFPPSLLGTYSSTNEGIPTVSADIGDNVTDIGIPEESSTFDIIVAMGTFDIVGLPTWLRLMAVIIPLLVLGLGIYGLVRGI